MASSHEITYAYPRTEYSNLNKYNVSFSIPSRGKQPSSEFPYVTKYTTQPHYQNVTYGTYTNGYYTTKNAYNAIPCQEYEVVRCPTNVPIPLPSPTASAASLSRPSAVSSSEGYHHSSGPVASTAPVTKYHIVVSPNCIHCNNLIQHLQRLVNTPEKVNLLKQKVTIHDAQNPNLHPIAKALIEKTKGVPALGDSNGNVIKAGYDPKHLETFVDTTLKEENEPRPVI